jgi:hypothetical protein
MVDPRFGMQASWARRSKIDILRIYGNVRLIQEGDRTVVDKIYVE